MKDCIIMDASEKYYIESAMKGDSIAFGFLVEKYYGVVYSTALRFLRNFDDALDITQDVFVEAFENLKHLRDPYKFGSWIQGITINLSKLWLRRHKKEVPLEEIDHENSKYFDYIGNSDPYLEYEQKQLKEKVEKALNNLSENNRLVIKLYYMDDMSYKEIASFLGIPMTTVEGRIFRAKRQLRDEMIDIAKDMCLCKARPVKYAASNESVITDPYIDLRYIRVKELSGKSDIIQYTMGLSLSPNGNFLLWNKTIVPLGNGEPFDLTDMKAFRGSFSPDNQKVAFYSNGSIWITNISPETDKPIDSPRKLLDGEYWYQSIVNWSPDSRKFAFERRDSTTRGNICAISIDHGVVREIVTDVTYKGNPVWSPDGQTIAYQKDGKSVWLAPVEDGMPKCVIERQNDICPISWTPDSRWLVCDSKSSGSNIFLRVEDKHEIEISIPKEVGSYISWSSNKKMVFYCPSYDYRSTLQVVSTSGGQPVEIAKQKTLWPYEQFWYPDNKMIIAPGEHKGDDWVFWIIPISGKEPLKLEIDVPSSQPTPHSLSPDSSKILYLTEQKDGTFDIYVAPISLIDARTVGVPIKIFDGWDKRLNRDISWSPDSKKVAIIKEGDLWIAAVDRYDPIKITNTIEYKSCPVWSPDSRLIAYQLYHSSGKAEIQVIESSGGECLKVYDSLGEYRFKYEWSMNSSELILITEELQFIAVSAIDGSKRSIADLANIGMVRAHCLRRSPDGRRFAITGTFENEESQVIIINVGGGEIVRLGAEDPGDKSFVYWSPDGKWLSYCSDKMVKTRPEGTLWELDVLDFLKKKSSQMERS